MRKKILIIVSFLSAVLVFNACLKDDVGMDWTSSLEGKMYAEVWNGGKATLALQPVATPVTFKFLVNIASDKLPTENITLTLAVNDSARARYNRLNKTSFKLYPYIEVLTPTVVIEKGTRNAYAYVKVWNAQLLNACDNFMAPVSIVSATGGVIPADPVSTGSRLMTLPISNPYAGDYHTVGYRIRPGNATEPVNATQTVSTVDCKTVIKSGFGNYPYDIKIEITTNTIVVGGVTCYKCNLRVIDPATGVPLAGGEGMFTTWSGDPLTPPAPPANNTEINYYNPVTKIFVLNCYYVSSAGNRIMYEVLTRI
ncbi:MAG: DUF1735 domain-containing protein [Bacteroidia bacterium]|nr:DUF1735 domain-containing protein [Bacteroidia bacterium]